MKAFPVCCRRINSTEVVRQLETFACFQLFASESSTGEKEEAEGEGAQEDIHSCRSNASFSQTKAWIEQWKQRTVGGVLYMESVCSCMQRNLVAS